MTGMICFSQTKLTALGKTGKATPDKDGYYELVLGGLNTHNNSGAWYYTAEKVRELFGPGSLLHRKIANGCLRAEVNHPQQRPGEKLEDFYARMMDIDLNNVCAHISKIWLDENYGKNNPHLNNPSLIAIMGLVKPAAPKGEILKEGLENPNENVCFSIRSLAEESFIRGKRVRTIQEVITFDLVNEGGILIASKWDSPATETISNDINKELSTPIVREILERSAQKQKNRVFSLESGDISPEYVLSKYFPKQSPRIYNRW